MSDCYEIHHTAHSYYAKHVPNLRAWLKDKAIDQASLRQYVTRLSEDTILCSTSYNPDEMVDIWNRLHSNKEDARDEYYKREYDTRIYR
jgi:hypothetical protein